MGVFNKLKSIFYDEVVVDEETQELDKVSKIVRRETEEKDEAPKVEELKFKTVEMDPIEAKEEEVKEEVQETVEEKADEKETSNEHTSEEKSTEVKEEMADVNAKVDATEETLKPITEEDSKLVIKKVDQKLNIFQKIKKFLFG